MERPIPPPGYKLVKGKDIKDCVPEGAHYDMKTNAEILKARMEGATAALEGRKLDANTYEETDDLHFEWLAGWTSARMEMQKRRGQNAESCHGRDKT